MRIIAGTHRGRRIDAPRGERTRPVSDFAREALFSMLGPVDDAIVLDLFAGSGALGLEALSRGASRCVFVDDDRNACRTITANLQHLGLTGATVLRRAAASVLREEASAKRVYDLVLIDPPYDVYATVEPKLAELVPLVLAPDAIVAVSTGARTVPSLPLEQLTSRRYGSARITLFTP
ncbi:MAG: 16S rRNA (guanine(966)-N(2))-methyltransferase RsmD [Gaiella sp.]